MDNILLDRLELALINFSDWQCIGNPVCGYSDFLQAVCQGSYESALSFDIVTQLLNVGNEDLLNPSAVSIQNLLCKKIEAFLLTQPVKDARLRQVIVMSIGITCLQLFVQNNWVGPATICSLEHLFSVASEKQATNERNAFLCECIHSGLSIDDESVYQLSAHPLYLFIAKIILWNCCDLLNECQTVGLWLLRLIKTLQSMLEERSATLQTVVMQTVSCLSAKPFFNESVPDYTSLQIQFHLEAGHLSYFFYESSLAKHHFAEANRLSQLSVELTGALGKRTRFQANDISQLILDVKYANVDQFEFADRRNACPVDQNLLPKAVKLDDESVLEEISLKNPENAQVINIAPVQQAMVLGMCHNHRRTHESEGQGKIVQEESMAFINYVLVQPRNWCVQTMALLLRSRWEKDSPRRIYRSVMQMEELVKQFKSEQVPGYARLPLVYAVSLPPLWAIERELGRLYDEINAVSSALDVYLRLQSWEDVIGCYTKLGHRQKAETLIREQLAVKETANLWCYLGDVTSDPEHYHRAWNFSNGRSARSQRALAYYHFNRREMKQSLPFFEKSLEISPLQVGVWFTFGCVCLECEEYEKASTAFRRCVNLDSDNFAAWSNLATSYIKANNKPRAFLTYQEALKCDYENWRVWENYLVVATDIGEFGEAIKAYHRLIELRHKHTDVPVLKVLVRAVCEKLEDASGEPAEKHKPKLLKLFGHLTANVTNCADIWSLYATLLTCDGTADKTTIERALHCLKAAHNCATLDVNWEKDVKKCVEICQLSHQLAKAYVQCANCMSTSEDIDRVKSSGRLLIKGVIAKIRKHYTDGMPAEIGEHLILLENDVSLIEVNRQ